MILLDFQGKLCTLFLNTFPAVNELTEKMFSKNFSSEDDLNYVKMPGIYSVFTAKNAPENDSENNKIGTLIVNNIWNGFAICQIYFSVWNGNIFYRSFSSNTWSDWKQKI